MTRSEADNRKLALRLIAGLAVLSATVVIVVTIVRRDEIRSSLQERIEPPSVLPDAPDAAIDSVDLVREFARGFQISSFLGRSVTNTLEDSRAAHDRSVRPRFHLGDPPRLAGPEALEAVRRLLTDRDPLVRLAAIRCIGAFGAAGRPAVPDVVEIIETGSATEHWLGVLIVRLWVGCDSETTARIMRCVLDRVTNDRDAWLLIGDYTPSRFQGLPDALRAATSGADARIRARAIGVLAEESSIDDVEFYVQHLDDPNASVRAAAVKGMDTVLPDEEIGPFSKCLDDEAREVRQAALRVIGKRLVVGNDERVPRKLIDKLLRSVERGDTRAALSFARIDDLHLEDIERLAPLLDADDSYVKRAAAMALGATAKLSILRPEREELVRSIVSGLAGIARDASDAAARIAAIDALGRFGPQASDASDAVLAALDDPSEEIRDEAFRCLVRLGPAAARHAKAFGTRVAAAGSDSSDTEDLDDGLAIVDAMGVHAKPAIDALLDAYENEAATEDQREAIVRALLPLVEGEARIVPRLTRWLDGDPASQLAAAGLLARAGPAAAAAVADILEIDGALSAADVAPEDPRVVRGLAELVRDHVPDPHPHMGQPRGDDCGVRAVLERCGPAARATVPDLASVVLVECADPIAYDDVDELDAAIRALGAIGPAAAAAVPALLRLLDVPIADGRAEAAEALGRIGARADVVVPALVSVLIERKLRLSALRGLERFGPAASDAIPAIVRHLDDDDWRVREQVARMLGHLAALPDVVGPALVRALDDTTFQVRVRAAWALGELGSAALEHRIALEKRRDDPDSRVRWQVEKSLKRVTTGTREPTGR